MEQKILQYEGPVRNEEIVLKVASYAYGNQLFVGMMRPGEEEESYGDLTINLPYEDVERNESNLEDIKDELHIMETDYDNGIWYEDSLSEELYYYSRIEDKLSVYMEKVKVNFTTVNLKEAH